MGEKVVVVQDGVQKQPKGWGCPVVVGEQEEEEEEEAGEGSELLYGSGHGYGRDDCYPNRIPNSRFPKGQGVPWNIQPGL